MELNSREELLAHTPGGCDVPCLCGETHRISKSQSEKSWAVSVRIIDGQVVAAHHWLPHAPKKSYGTVT